MLDVHNRKVFSGTRASQRLSNNFKSISRDKGPHWSNRFVKDHYDLVYDADPYSISSKFNKQREKQKGKEIKNETIESPIQKYEYSPYKSREMAKTSQSQRTNKAQNLNPENYMTNFREYQKGIRNGQQTAPSTDKKNRFIKSSHKKVRIQQFDDGQKDRGLNKQEDEVQYIQEEEDNALNKVNMLGLCHFQFQKTIQGKLLTKSNNHIDFSRNKTFKINNVVTKYYDYSKDIVKEQAVLDKEKYKVLDKIHAFKSYSAHKLYQKDRRFDHDNGCGHGGFLDKYYEITKPEIYDFNHETANKNNVDYYTMTSRPDLRKKQGTNLQYEGVHSHKTLGLLNNKRPMLTMSKTQRKLTFTRQVISPKRGCYR